MKKSSFKLITFSAVFLFLIAVFLPSYEVAAKTVIDKKTNQKYKLIETKKDLIKEFRSHVLNLDPSFRLYIGKEVIKDFDEEFDDLWKEIAKDLKFNEIWRHKKSYSSELKDFSKSKAKCILWNITDLTFSISKKEAEKIKKEAEKIITSKKELKKAYLSNVFALNEEISLNISKKVMKNFEKDYTKFMNELYKDPAFRKLSAYTKVRYSTPYDYKDFWRWNIGLTYELSKESADEIKSGKSSLLKTKDEVIEALITRVNRLDEKIVLEVDPSVIDFTDGKQYVNLWDEIYGRPEFTDVFVYSKDFENTLVDRGQYLEWNFTGINNLTKAELTDLKNYVKRTVLKLIGDKMSEEEKVRAINDFMTKEFSYHYGEEGKEWYKIGDNRHLAKLGKYSVNTAFSLFYKKGGVSDAFANMFYRLAKEAGLEVKVVAGKSGEDRVAWNMVKVGGTWYHIATFHNMDGEEGAALDNRLYYLKSDKVMDKVWKWEKEKYPKADKEYK